MLTAHEVGAFLTLASCVLAAGAALVSHRIGRAAGHVVTQLLALAQTLLVAQVALGLLLVAGGRHAAQRVHYMYGGLALLATLSPWLYAPPEPRRRLLWFGAATLVASVLVVRAYMTA